MPPQTLLLPSLYALASATSLPSLLAHLSLLSIHVEPYFLHDTIYTASVSVLPGQPRSVRLRSVRRRARSSAKGKARADGDEWDHSLVYLSNPLSGREYAEMSVRACLDVDVASTQSRKEIEAFVEALAMTYSHSYTQRGTLFHLPLSPSSTLHITVVQINAHSPRSPHATVDTPPDPKKAYVVEMKPARPVGAASEDRDKMSLQEVMDAMRAMSERIEGLDWSSGRS